MAWSEELLPAALASRGISVELVSDKGICGLVSSSLCMLMRDIRINLIQESVLDVTTPLEGPSAIWEQTRRLCHRWGALSCPS